MNELKEQDEKFEEKMSNECENTFKHDMAPECKNDNDYQVSNSDYEQASINRSSEMVMANSFEITAPTKKTNMFTGVLGALLGAALGAFIWSLLYNFGYIALASAALIPIFSFILYDSCKGKRNAVRPIICFLSSFLALVAAECIMLVRVIYSVFSQFGISLKDSIMILPEMITMPETQSGLFLDLGFSALAILVGGVFIMFLKRGKRKSTDFETSVSSPAADEPPLRDFEE